MENIHQDGELGLDQRPQTVLQRRHNVLQKERTHNQTRDTWKESEVKLQRMKQKDILKKTTKNIFQISSIVQYYMFLLQFFIFQKTFDPAHEDAYDNTSWARRSWNEIDRPFRLKWLSLGFHCDQGWRLSGKRLVSACLAFQWIQSHALPETAM